MRKKDTYQNQKHFYRYSEKESDYKRLNKIFGFTAALILPIFVVFAYFSTLPNIYAEVTLSASLYIFLIIGITSIFKSLRKYMFPFYFVFFCIATSIVWLDLLESRFETTHMMGFIFLYAVITIAIQRYIYAVLYNTIIFLIILISYLVIGEEKDNFIIMSCLVFIAGSVSILVLFSRNKMIKRIQDYSTYLASIINQPGIGIALINSEEPFEIIDYNNAFFYILGNDFDIHKSDNLIRKTVSNNWENINKSRYEFEISSNKKWIEIHFDKILLQEGVFYLAKIIDITESKRQTILSKQNETKFRLLFEEGNDAIFLTKKGIIEHANLNTEKLLELTVDEVIGKSLWEFGSNELDSNLLKEKFINLNIEQSGQKLEWDFVKSTGEKIHVEILVALMFAHGERIEQCVVRDITAQKNYETKLKNAHQSFKNIIENIPEAILLFKENKIIFANTEAYRMLNFTEKNQHTISIEELFLEENKEIFINAINQHSSKKNIVNNQVSISVFNTKEIIEVEFTLTPTLYNGEKVSMLILKDISLINKLAGERSRLDSIEKINKQLIYEIEERRKTEKLLEEQSLKLKAIIENSSNTLIWTVDINFKLLMFNGYFFKTVQQLFNLDLEVGMNMLQFFVERMENEEGETIVNNVHKVLKGQATQIETKLIIETKQFWFETFLNPIFDTEGNVIEISCVSHNTTDKKENEQELINSLHEKEILLKEVHHRVKNNLQVISSILNLQSSYVTDESTQAILKESQNRIKSMSYIHENLYQKDKFSSIDFSDYIFNLSNNLVHSYQIFDNLVEIKYEMDSVNLSLDQAIPCGLIVNELVSNALKYAFPDRKKGELLIQLKKENKKIKLTIGDNGIGLPKDFDIEKSETLGLQLVLTLIDQLDAQVDIQRDGGTKYFITFELLKE